MLIVKYCIQDSLLNSSIGNSSNTLTDLLCFSIVDRLKGYGFCVWLSYTKRLLFCFCVTLYNEGENQNCFCCCQDNPIRNSNGKKHDPVYFVICSMLCSSLRECKRRRKEGRRKMKKFITMTLTVDLSLY